MKATELRIGNYVEFNMHEPNYHHPIEDGIDIDNADIWNPIPLTEEWLLKFGFCQSEKDEVYYDGLFNYALNSYKSIWHFYAHNEVNGNKWFLRDLQYVHQLQNLYFALIGEELIIKP